MESKTTIDRKKVTIVSEYNGISVSLVEKFLANFFTVKVVCGERNLWKRRSPYLFSKDCFFIESFKSNDIIESDFAVFISCFFDNLSSISEKELIAKETKRLLFFFSSIKTKKKKFLILPHQIYNKTELKLVEVYKDRISLQNDANLFVCFVDELVGPRLVLSLRREASSALCSYFTNRNLFFCSRQTFLRIGLLGDFSREFVNFVSNTETIRERKILFSGQRIDRSRFLDMLKTSLKINTDNFESVFVEPQKSVFEKEVVLTEEITEKKLLEAFVWFQSNADDSFFEDTDTHGLYKNKVDVFEKAVVKEPQRDPYHFFAKFFYDFFSFLGKIWLYLCNVAGTIKSVLIFRKAKIGRIKSVLEDRKTHFLDKIKRKKKNVPVILKKKSIHSARKMEWRANPIPFTLLVRANFGFLFAVLKLIFIFLFFVFVFPSILVGMSGILFYMGYRSFKSYNLSRAVFFLKSSETGSYLLSENYYNLAKIPLLGNYYLFLGESSSLIHDSSRVFGLGISLVKNASFFYEKSVKGQEVNVLDFSRSLFLDLNSLYFQTSLLEGKIVDLEKRHAFLGRLFETIDFNRHRKEIVSAKEIALFLPEILGEKEEKKYLALFQNNMELRATGGFIGSFAILTFKRGTLSNIEVYDVYTADGQLKGYVEPPWQIRKYLGEATWYLRDSNWDPDFSVSAKRAEWFLNKSMGIEVDGVFSFDVSFVRDLVSVIGELYVSDYDKTVNEKIFYDVVQYEAEKDFFPGSRQKSSFLMALSRSLLFEVKEARLDVLLSFLPVFYTNLNERHLQLFFNNEDIQKKIGFLGWDGGLNKRFCFSENCFEDFVGLVESNFGVNKVNYFVSRKVSLRVDVDGSFVKREMEVVFENKAPIVLGDKGRYKNYFRIFVPNDVFIEKVAIQDGNSFVDANADQGVVREMKEVGFWFEIPPSSRKKVVVVWKSDGVVDLTKNGEYRFVFRKQAGIDEIPFRFEARFPFGFKPAFENLQLTSGGVFVYNQASIKNDFFTRLYW